MRQRLPGGQIEQRKQDGTEKKKKKKYPLGEKRGKWGWVEKEKGGGRQRPKKPDDDHRTELVEEKSDQKRIMAREKTVRKEKKENREKIKKKKYVKEIYYNRETGPRGGGDPTEMILQVEFKGANSTKRIGVNRKGGGIGGEAVFPRPAGKKKRG